MVRVVRFIGFLMLAWTLWLVAGGTFTGETVDAGKAVDEKTAALFSALSLHREKLYDATACHRCLPVCEYYIFTLRRILI